MSRDVPQGPEGWNPEAQRRFWDGRRRELEVVRHLEELMGEGGVFVNTVVEP